MGDDLPNRWEITALLYLVVQGQLFQRRVRDGAMYKVLILLMRLFLVSEVSP